MMSRDLRSVVVVVVVEIMGYEYEEDVFLLIN